MRVHAARWVVSSVLFGLFIQQETNHTAKQERNLFLSLFWADWVLCMLLYALCLLLFFYCPPSLVPRSPPLYVSGVFFEHLPTNGSVY